MSSALHLTETEWTIMKQVWRLEPVPAPTVQEALVAETGWTYSTVRTVMDRMVKKRILKAEKLRNLTLFSSLIKEREAQQTKALSTLQTAFNGALTPFVQCLLDSNNLSASELTELEQLIKSKRKN